MKKMGTRTNQKLLVKMYQTLMQHGPMTSRHLSEKIQELYPNNKRFHRGANQLSQLMVARPKQYKKVDKEIQGGTAIWGAIFIGKSLGVEEE